MGLSQDSGDFCSPISKFYVFVMFYLLLWVPNSTKSVSYWIWSAGLQISYEKPCGGSWNRDPMSERIRTPKGKQLVRPLSLTVFGLENFYYFKNTEIMDHLLSPLIFWKSPLKSFFCVFMLYAKCVYRFYSLYKAVVHTTGTCKSPLPS